jgi:excinuclease ABC subunit B
MTPAMEGAIGETERRRGIQMAYNEKHGITPQTIKKAVHDISEEQRKLELRRPKRDHTKIPRDEKQKLIKELNAQMEIAAENLEFEKAADLRDEIELLERELRAGK